jgi:hypothetical protein
VRTVLTARGYQEKAVPTDIIRRIVRGWAPDWKRYEQPTMDAPESEFPIFMNIFATPKRKTLQVKL